MHNPLGVVQTSGKTGGGADLVQSYLDSLLRDVSAGFEQDELLAVPPEPVATIAAPIVITPVAETPILKSPLVETTTNKESVSLPLETTLSDEPAEPADLSLMAVALDPKAVRVLPDWARQGFAGLVFEVAGLKMAAPLHALGGISLIEDRLQPVVGQADWFMGLLRWNGRNLRVVDTARFVMPERLENNSHHSAYQSVIVLGDSHWALAVDCADESVNLTPDEIRWKQLIGTRPWLAGTVLQRLCALLDVDNLMGMLQQHEQHVRECLVQENKN